jgi:hypothetical protein
VLHAVLPAALGLELVQVVAHEPAPVAELAVPAAQLVHVELPAAENLPAAQSLVQSAVAPEDVEYLPALQSVQPVKPAAFVALYFPAGQSMHTDAPASEYLPLAQLTQGVAAP